MISVYANFATIVAATEEGGFLNEALKFYHYLCDAVIVIGVYGTACLNNEKTVAQATIQSPEIILRRRDEHGTVS